MKSLTVFFQAVLLFLLFQVTNAQEAMNPSSRVQGLAGFSVALTDCWSVFGNQAGLSNVNQMTVGGAYVNKFLLKEMSLRSAFLLFPIQSSVFAISLSQFGKSPFRHEKFGLAYARRLSDCLSFGMQFNYFRILFPEENKMVGSSGLQLGAQYQVNSNLVFGVHLTNPYTSKIRISSGTYQLDRRINFGGMYSLSNSFRMMAELENGFDNRFTVRTAMEYDVQKKFFVRSGVSGKPYQLSAGFGFQAEKLIVDVATSYNQYLGNSPSVSFQYRF